MLKQGLYEQVINQIIRRELDSDIKPVSSIAPIDRKEVPKILSTYLADIIEKVLESARDNGISLATQIGLINSTIKSLSDKFGTPELAGLSVDEKVEQLLSLFYDNTSMPFWKSPKSIIRPESSLSRSSLFTGSENEPSLYSELNREIMSSNSVDMLVSFIKWSGLRLIIKELQTITANGGHLRVITTSYMGATDMKAIEELSKLQNTSIKVSYDTKRTRLHAKTYIFHRDTGFSTAYVGSSNLSNAAISSGLEWNIKVTAKDLPDTMKRVNATFESYWNSNEFENYTVADQKHLEDALRAEKYSDSGMPRRYLFDVVPYSFQQEILDKLKAEREVHNSYKNLIVAATGTGKTVISAFDYNRFCRENPGKPNRLLFVAHREEILRQAIECFRGIMKDYNFGDLFVGNFKPDKFDHLFVSIQTLNSQNFIEGIPDDYYDYIVVDEFHHAAASTYQKLLVHFHPKILLGLTATPERMDGKSVLGYFDNHIAAEIRLPEAIERKLLSPFQYFGVTDSVNLDTMKWARGGYDRADLDRMYAEEPGSAVNRANLIIESLLKYVTDIREVKGLAFCVSVKHATFMSDYFNREGIESIWLSGQSPDEDRFRAKKRLTSGEIRFIFVVDLYNEGVDIPEVNTILFLRPTESLTVFLQQLGRGLRITEGKDVLTVLDFVGRQNNRYNLEEKFASLLARSSRGVLNEIKNGFEHLPRGCYIQLERKAEEYVLDNIKKAIGTRTGLISKIATFENDSGMPATLENFVKYYHMNVRDIYRKSSFSRLKANAGIMEDFHEPAEKILDKAFLRISAINSRRWINFLLKILPSADTLKMDELSCAERRMVQMFHFTVWQKPPQACGFLSPKDGFVEIFNSPVMLSELIALLKFNLSNIDFVDEPVDLGFDSPLDLHCNYSRDQILAAMDFKNPSTVREGVKYIQEKNVDVFFITLNKSDKDYSPSTMYEDYSVSDRLFHWQSQNTTSDTSSTGYRYINHKKLNCRILLFVRENKEDIVGASQYTFLGLAEYVQHEGSKPMNILWKLNRPIPAKYLRETNKLVIP